MNAHRSRPQFQHCSYKMTVRSNRLERDHQQLATKAPEGNLPPTRPFFERKGKASARGFRCRRRGLSQTYSAATHLRPDGRIAGRQGSTLATVRPCAARSNMRWSSATSWRYSFTEETVVVKKTPEKLTHFAHMSPGLKNHRSQHVSRVSGVDDRCDQRKACDHQSVSMFDNPP